MLIWLWGSKIVVCCEGRALNRGEERGLEWQPLDRGHPECHLGLASRVVSTW